MEDFTHGYSRELQRESASSPNASFYRIGKHTKVPVSRVQLAPGVADAYDGALHIVIRVAHSAQMAAPGQVHWVVRSYPCLTDRFSPLGSPSARKSDIHLLFHILRSKLYKVAEVVKAVEIVGVVGRSVDLVDFDGFDNFDDLVDAISALCSQGFASVQPFLHQLTEVLAVFLFVTI